MRGSTDSAISFGFGVFFRRIPSSQRVEKNFLFWSVLLFGTRLSLAVLRPLSFLGIALKFKFLCQQNDNAAAAVVALLFFLSVLSPSTTIYFSAKSWTDNMLRTINFIEKSHIGRNECKIRAKNDCRTVGPSAATVKRTSTILNIDDAMWKWMHAPEKKNRHRKGRRRKTERKRQINLKARRDWMRVKRENNNNREKKGT